MEVPNPTDDARRPAGSAPGSVADSLLLAAAIIQIATAFGVLILAIFHGQAVALLVILLASAASTLYSRASGRFRWIPVGINVLNTAVYASALALLLADPPEDWAFGRALPRIVVFVTLLAPSLAICVLVLQVPSPPPRPVDHHDAEAVLDAARRLEREGEWDRAIELYTHVATTWPAEYGEYADNCIKCLREKLAFAEQGGQDA